jgi:5-methylcytosine-specific restriction protein A
MTNNREFPNAVKIAVIKRCTRDGVVYCEGCGLPAKRRELDHIIARSAGGTSVLSNAQLLCEVCHGSKTKRDTRVAAKIKRVEANYLGAKPPPKKKIQSRGFPKGLAKAPKIPIPPRISLYEDSR